VGSGSEFDRPPVTRADPAALADVERRLHEALLAEPAIRWAYLFGSAARGEPFRDIDVGVMLVGTARGAVALGRVAAAIEAAALPFAVDVVDLASAVPALAGRIAREGRVLVDSDHEARLTWEVEANSRGLDIEPWLAEFERLRNEALRQRAG
jgi:predicted nucleotidyltransferase